MLTALLAVPAASGGSAERVLLLIDPTNAASLEVGNRYRQARSIPERNVLYMAPMATTYAGFLAVQKRGFEGQLANLGLSGRIDYVVLSAGTPFFTSAAGLVGDGCSPVTRFAAPTPYTLALAFPSVPPGADSSLPNGYHAAHDAALAFDSTIAWSAGAPASSGGTRYYIGAQLGYDGTNGNSVAEILSMIDRSVAADGSFPSGSFFYCQTGDAARSGPRHGFYPAAVATLSALGFPAQHLLANLPPAGATALSVMTGLADPAIDASAFTLAPGSFADHLTSYAATYDSASQTKMSRWIAKGASGTSGTVEEPCNYAGKFPHARLHVFYAQGLSLGEAWLRSLAYAPFQQLFNGDPLCRPFAHLPQPALAGLPGGDATGTLALTPSAVTAHPSATIARFELLVDGLTLAARAPGGHFALDTRALDDGWHELRLLASDSSPQRSTGSWIGALTSSNHGRSATLTAPVTTGNYSRRFDFTVTALDASGGSAVRELRLLQGSRVVAAGSGSPLVLPVYGRTLGAGRSRLLAEAEFADGRRARSAPLELEILSSSNGPSELPPIAFSHTRRLRTDAACVLELPATLDHPVDALTFTLLSAPAQAALLGGSGPWRVVRPNPGASGSDTLLWQVANAFGTATATLTLIYEDPLPCPPPQNYCISAPNSTGLGARMTSSGSTSIAQNDLQLACYDLPATTSGIFYYGTAALQQPFGNGWRCVGGAATRLGVQQVSIFGDVSRAVDFSQAPFASGPAAWTAGATRHVQFWYRNPAGGGAGFNLSDGLALTLCP